MASEKLCDLVMGPDETYTQTLTVCSIYLHVGRLG